ncbi:hypothetical protein MVES1_000961 [Malassezia vespertilionis]|uniref:PQ loop repeat protein n=1 Tax=Malassezia vespertilionis TaxID=2020962 RepID=A0A2N1JFI9_9BASI|nr:uncharacterized protein MVES1_000961 [Malassezia vespertilionis]PKI85296.1 hypothetical protein MVES_000903 [Malassezia vespertilionis]WFD05629.1 hypothetical protein MVES1_000961 [Malassezia vespertilionis]
MDVPAPMPPQCDNVPDASTFALAMFLCFGVIMSYVPQILRIYYAGSSLGLSPWYLFLGATSSACAMFNVFVLEYPTATCCSTGLGIACIEQYMGVIQVSSQWLMFVVVFGMYLCYYPVSATRAQRKNRRNRDTAPDENDPLQDNSSGSDSDLETIHSHIHQTYGSTPLAADIDLARHAGNYRALPHAMRQILEQYHLPGEDEISGLAGTSTEWRISKALAVAALLQFHLCFAVSVFVLIPGRPKYQIKQWATVLGFAAAILAVLQYLPQIWYTVRTRLVQSLSLATMCIQVPGTFLFIYVLTLREDLDWTSFLAYVCAGILQLVLLALCLAWKIRQKRLGVDDYGRPFVPT